MEISLSESESEIESRLHRNSLGSAPQQPRRRRRTGLSHSEEGMRRALEEYGQLISEEQRRLKEYRLTDSPVTNYNRQYLKSAPIRRAGTLPRNEVSSSSTSIETYRQFLLRGERCLDLLRATSRLIFAVPRNPVIYHNLAEKDQWRTGGKPLDLLICSSQATLLLLIPNVQLGRRGLELVFRREMLPLNVYELCEYIKFEEAGNFNLLFQVLLLDRGDEGY